ncbi:hypothetical protein SOHN41_01207 [Shewanella sp. HN-41]|nr:hypothetical protein SOHN41_01207 [Shewanella sp. HN-41]
MVEIFVRYWAEVFILCFIWREITQWLSKFYQMECCNVAML